MKFDLAVTVREKSGKGVARQLRRSGKVPAVLYGQGECLLLTIEPEPLIKILKSQAGSTALITLTVNGAKTKPKRTALLRDFQVDPVEGHVLHADLFEISMDKAIRVKVPVHVIGGTPVGVKEGGILHYNTRELHVECLPDALPDHIEIDASGLGIGQGVHLKEMVKIKGVRFLDDPDQMVVSVAVPMSDAKPIVFVVDDDISVRESLRSLIDSAGWQPVTSASGHEFLSHPRALAPSCLVLDVVLPDINGLDLQKRVAVERTDIPIILISGHGDIPMTVRAMKAGAVEFLTKPLVSDALLNAIEQAIERSRTTLRHEEEMQTLRDRYALLTPREREVTHHGPCGPVEAGRPALVRARRPASEPPGTQCSEPPRNPGRFISWAPSRLGSV